MANVQLDQGFTRIANRLLTAMALASWDSGAQRQLVDALVRVTYGFNRKDAEIGTAGWRALTGLSPDAVKRARAALAKHGVILLVEKFDAAANRPQRWQLQKDFTKWGKYSVPEPAVAEAEAAAAEIAGEGAPPPGAQTPPGGANTPRGDEDPQGAQTPRGQGAPAPPPPGAQTPPGAGRKPPSGNDFQGGKDREIQERQETHTPGARTREEGPPPASAEDAVLAALEAAGVPAEARDDQRSIVRRLLREHPAPVLLEAIPALPQHALSLRRGYFSANTLEVDGVVTECLILARGGATNGDGGGSAWLDLPPELKRHGAREWADRVDRALRAACATDPDLERQMDEVGAHIAKLHADDRAFTNLGPERQRAHVWLRVLNKYGQTIGDAAPEGLFKPG